MQTIYDNRCTVTVEKKEESVVLTTSYGLRWEAKTSRPQIAITNVIANCMARFYTNQQEFDEKFMIEINIQRIDDE